MASIIAELAELGFQARGCFRTGHCESCHSFTTIWWWKKWWLCDECVFQRLLQATPLKEPP